MISKDIILRRSMRIPRHFMGTPLPPLFPHATSTLPTSLPTRPIFRHTLLLRRLRLYHLMAPTQGPNPNRSYYLGIGSLELEPSFPSHLCCSLD
jgi:hypothetical protein